MTEQEMYTLIRAQADQPTPRRETEIDRRFEQLRKEDATFAAFWATYRLYRGDLEYWCKWTQNGAPDTAGARPDRPSGIPDSLDRDMLTFYRLA